MTDEKSPPDPPPAARQLTPSQSGDFGDQIRRDRDRGQLAVMAESARIAVSVESLKCLTVAPVEERPGLGRALRAAALADFQQAHPDWPVKLSTDGREKARELACEPLGFVTVGEGEDRNWVTDLSAESAAVVAAQSQ